MSHEPECRQMRIRQWQICDCSVIRSAYKRGRQEASVAARHELRRLSEDEGRTSFTADDLRVIDAARGNPS